MPNDDDLYSQRDMPPDKSSKSSDDDDDDGEDEQKTALVPKSIFGGHKCEVGDIKKFRIVEAYDDEFEVEYVRSDKDGDKDKSKGRMEESERELDDMATES